MGRALMEIFNPVMEPPLHFLGCLILSAQTFLSQRPPVLAESW